MNLPESPAGDTWSQYRAYLDEVLPQSTSEDRGYDSSQRLRQFGYMAHALEEKYASTTKEYLTFAESVLRTHGAALPGGASTSEQPAAGIGTQSRFSSQGSGYKRYGEHTTAPVHLKAFYDELYEACWKGDNASIRELCLPKQSSEGKGPIQIIVQATTDNDPYASYGALLVGAVLKSSIV